VENPTEKKSRKKRVEWKKESKSREKETKGGGGQRDKGGPKIYLKGQGLLRGRGKTREGEKTGGVKLESAKYVKPRLERERREMGPP